MTECYSRQGVFNTGVTFPAHLLGDQPARADLPCHAQLPVSGRRHGPRLGASRHQHLH
jgi:hypothetical protein